MDIPMVRPKALTRGDTVAIIAPAGPIEQRDDLLKGVAALERMGFCVRFDDRIFHSVRYLAGADEERAEELMHAFEDPGVQAIVSLRGGFGCSRLIPLIHQGRLRNRCKIFMGFSDLTTLHLFFRRRFGWVTFHGPMAASSTLGNIGLEQEKHLLALWTDPAYVPSLSFPELETWVPGSAEGELIGGCLSLVVASLGTPYEPSTEGKILFLEDFGEPPYRIDRMLTQLRLARKLDRIAGLLLGHFQDCEPSNSAYTLEETLRDVLGNIEVPVLAHFPAGHGSENWVLALGTRIRLDASSRRVEFLESSVAPRT
jgi:muramoyltetrapeptide carboxypeptidase